MKTHILIILGIILITISCCNSNKFKKSVFSELKSDTTFFNRSFSVPDISVFQKRINEIKRNYGDLSVQEINPPTRINEMILKKTLKKFQSEIDTVVPQMHLLSHFTRFLYANELKTQEGIRSCSFSIIPCFRLTPNVMSITDFENQQFVDFLTLDTISYIVLARRKNEIIDLFSFRKKEAVSDLSNNGDKINAVNVALSFTKSLIAIVPPDYESGSSHFIFGFKKNNRIQIILPIGDISFKNEDGKYHKMNYLYKSFDNNVAFSKDGIVEKWLTYYVEQVENYRKNFEKIGSYLDPQIIVYPPKK